MKNSNKFYTLVLFLLLHFFAFSQTVLLSPTDDIGDGTDYCDPVYIDASNAVTTNGFDVELTAEETGFVALTDGFVATATANNFILAAIINNCVVSTGEAAYLIEKINTYPNPFTDFFELELTLKEAASIDFRIFDATGKAFRILIKSTAFSAGMQTVRFSTVDFPVGVYVYELQVDGHRQSGKITCVR